MALGDQATRWVNDWTFAAVGDIAIPDELVRLALLCKSETFEQNKLICGEAVVKFAHLDVLWRNASLLHRCFGRSLRHAESNEIHGTPRVKRRIVSPQSLTSHQDRLVPELRFS